MPFISAMMSFSGLSSIVYIVTNQDSDALSNVKDRFMRKARNIATLMQTYSHTHELFF